MYSLDPHHIDVWQFSLNNEDQISLSELDSEERERAQRYYFPHHRRRFILAHMAMRRILATYLKRDPASLVFQSNEYGKPRLEDLSNIEFNLSHSGDLALLAVGCSYPMGVDLECFKERAFAGIASTAFSSQEYLGLLKTPPSLKPLTFFHIWAQKEAFIKACGLGLAYPTQTFGVSILRPSHGTMVEHVDQEEHPWKMHTFMPAVGCAAALCYHPNVTSLQFGLVYDFT